MDKKVRFFEYIFTDRKKHGTRENEIFTSKFENFSDEATFEERTNTVEENDVLDRLAFYVDSQDEEDIEENIDSHDEKTIEETIDEVLEESLEDEEEKDQRLLNMIQSSKDSDTKDFFEEMKKNKEADKEDDLSYLQDLADSLAIKDDIEEKVKIDLNESLKDVDFNDTDVALKDALNEAKKDTEVKENKNDFDIPMI